MIKIKLQRVGKKRQPHYRIVASDTASPKKAIEFLGSYDPKSKTKQIKSDRINYWFGVGAKASDTVYNMLIKEGVIKGKKMPKHSRGKKGQEQEQEQEKEKAGENGEEKEVKKEEAKEETNKETMEAAKEENK